jgi:hypothetical protein
MHVKFHMFYIANQCRLLALGMMEYNTDWKAIRQRFLPCKSDNQVILEWNEKN